EHERPRGSTRGPRSDGEGPAPKPGRAFDPRPVRSVHDRRVGGGTRRSEARRGAPAPRARTRPRARRSVADARGSLPARAEHPRRPLTLARRGRTLPARPATGEESFVARTRPRKRTGGDRSTRRRTEGDARRLRLTGSTRRPSRATG